MSPRGLVRTCARCGHETHGCPHCGRYDGLLGGRIGDLSYCHTFVPAGQVSCYTVAVREQGVARLQASVDEQQKPSLTPESYAKLLDALTVAEAAVEDGARWRDELEAADETWIESDQALMIEVWLIRLENVRRALEEYVENHK